MILLISNQLISIEIRFGRDILRIIAIHLPHTDYTRTEFTDSIDDLSNLLIEAQDKRYRVIIDGDFNLSLRVG